MLGIVLCDSDLSSLQISVKTTCQALSQRQSLAQMAYTAANGAQLLRFLAKKPGAYLYFLDYGLEEEFLNGVDVGHIIRQWEPRSKIVFVTTNKESGIAILKSGVEPFGLIEKSTDVDRLAGEYIHYMDKALAQTPHKGKTPAMIELRVGPDETIPLLVAQIAYVDSLKTVPHLICYHTLDGSNVCVRGTLEHSLQELGSSFVQSHRAILVNKRYIVGESEGMLHLSNGEDVACAHRKKGAILRECLCMGEEGF